MSELMNVSGMGENELQLLQNRIIARQMEIYNKKFEELENRLKVREQQIGIFQQEITERLDKTEQIAVSKAKVLEPRFEFVNQGDFGRYFNPSISNQRIGKLFKIVGLAQKSKSITTPHREFIPDYAVTIAEDKYTTTKWHFKKCVSFLENWLKDHGHYEQFYSFSKEKALEKFIDELYLQYVA